MVGLMLSLTYTASRPSKILNCASTTVQYTYLARGHNIQQCRKFLSSSFNKTSLTKFLVGEWKGQRYRDMLQSKALYVTCEETCFKMTANEWVEVAELQSTQEEPDTRLHAARTGSRAVIVTAEDTDVMLLCMAFQKDIPCPIYQKCGTQNRTRFVDISKLALSLGDSVCDSLIGLHAFTGCDTVSAFASRGKLNALKLMQRDITYQETFSQVGQSWDVQPQLFEKV